MKKFIFIFLILNAVLFSQKKDINTINVNSGKNMPKWVTNPPKEKGFYFGVGKGETLEEAHKQAINIILNQVNVSVESELSLSKNVVAKTESDNSFSRSETEVNEELSKKVKMISKESLDDIEIVEAWYNEKLGYFVYCKLNIEEYKNKQKERIEQAKKYSLDLLKKCDEEKDIVIALKYAFIGYFTINKYTTSILVGNYNNQEVVIVNEFISRIQKLLKNITINSEKNEYELSKFSKDGLNIPLIVTENNNPVKNFPLSINTYSGKLRLNNSGITDNNGICICTISKILNNDKKHTIVIYPDILTFIKGSVDKYDEDEAKTFVSKIINLGIPSKQIIINVKYPTYGYNIVLNGFISDKKYEQELKKFSDTLKKTIKEKTGIEFALNNDNVELIFEVILDSFIKSSSQDEFEVSLTATYKLYSKNENKDIYKDNTPEVKSSEPSDQKAFKKSLDKINFIHSKKIIEKIIEIISTL